MSVALCMTLCISFLALIKVPASTCDVAIQVDQVSETAGEFAFVQYIMDLRWWSGWWSAYPLDVVGMILY